MNLSFATQEKITEVPTTEQKTLTIETPTKIVTTEASTIENVPPTETKPAETTITEQQSETLPITTTTETKTLSIDAPTLETEIPSVPEILPAIPQTLLDDTTSTAQQESIKIDPEEFPEFEPLVFDEKKEEDGILLAGANNDVFPFSYKSKEEKLVGFEIDLIKTIATNAKYKDVGFVETKQKMSFPYLIANKVPFISGKLIVSKSKSNIISYSIPYLETSLVIFISVRNITIKDENDLSYRRVGVIAGSYADEYLAKMKNINIVKYTKIKEQYKELAEGKIDAIIDEKIVGEFLINNYYSKSLKIIDKELEKIEYGFAVNKINKDLLLKINSSLDAIKKDGKYDEIYKKWFKDKIREKLQI
jgi:polar amino acid transport system substrate-binding protein